MASALGNLMANYTDSEGEEMTEGGSEGEGEGNPSLADRLDIWWILKVIQFHFFSKLCACYVFQNDSAY